MPLGLPGGTATGWSPSRLQIFGGVVPGGVPSEPFPDAWIAIWKITSRQCWHRSTVVSKEKDERRWGDISKYGLSLLCSLIRRADGWLVGEQPARPSRPRADRKPSLPPPPNAGQHRPTEAKQRRGGMTATDPEQRWPRK